jgi:hypothetical protein
VGTAPSPPALGRHLTCARARQDEFEILPDEEIPCPQALEPVPETGVITDGVGAGPCAGTALGGSIGSRGSRGSHGSEDLAGDPELEVRRHLRRSAGSEGSMKVVKRNSLDVLGELLILFTRGSGVKMMADRASSACPGRAEELSANQLQHHALPHKRRRCGVLRRPGAPHNPADPVTALCSC